MLNFHIKLIHLQYLISILFSKLYYTTGRNKYITLTYMDNLTNFFPTDATGKHTVSRIGFLKQSYWLIKCTFLKIPICCILRKHLSPKVYRFTSGSLYASTNRLQINPTFWSNVGEGRLIFLLVERLRSLENEETVVRYTNLKQVP